MGAFITVADLQVQNGEPRVEDLMLAQALGFADPHSIRRLVRRYRPELAVFGEVFSKRKKPTSVGGRPGEAYFLNEEQAIFITAKSDTPRAAEITVEMVRVFRDYLKGELKPVKVKAHRRALPQPAAPQAGSDLPFGFTLARELYSAVMAANVRIERGIERDFGKALEGVLGDIVTRHYGGDPSYGQALMGTKLHRERAEWATPLVAKN